MAVARRSFLPYCDFCMTALLGLAMFAHGSAPSGQYPAGRGFQFPMKAFRSDRLARLQLLPRMRMSCMQGPARPRSADRRPITGGTADRVSDADAE
jgi:hypothetical protein